MPGDVKLGIRLVTYLSEQASEPMVQYGCPDLDNLTKKGGGELPLQFLARLHNCFPPEASPLWGFAFGAERPKYFDGGLPRLLSMPAAYQPDGSGKWDRSASASEQLASGGCFNNRTALARFDLGAFGLPRSNFFAKWEV